MREPANIRYSAPSAGTSSGPTRTRATTRSPTVQALVATHGEPVIAWAELSLKDAEIKTFVESVPAKTLTRLSDPVTGISASRARELIGDVTEPMVTRALGTDPQYITASQLAELRSRLPIDRLVDMLDAAKVAEGRLT